MYLFVLYAALVWVSVFSFRRRWQSIPVLLLGVGAVYVAVSLLNWLFTTEAPVFEGPPAPGQSETHSSSPVMLPIVGYAYQALILLVGLALAAMPRPAHINACHHCGYELTGLDSGTCPECGKTFDPRRLKAGPVAPA